MNVKKVDELPSSEDEFWDGEKLINHPKPIDICETHTVDKYMEHSGYIDNHNGIVTCKFCPWGSMLPGYLRVSNGRLIDLRELSN